MFFAITKVGNLFCMHRFFFINTIYKKHETEDFVEYIEW